jgi:hypothetical protein
MKVTHIRVHKLVSGPGYNNTAVDIEAALEPGEDASDAIAALSARVTEEIEAITEKGREAQRQERITWEFTEAEKKVTAMRMEAEAVGKVLAKYTDLAAFALKLGINGAKELREAGYDGIPF